MNAALYATQGGGYAIWAGNRYVFVDPPEGYQLGENVPEQWEVHPITPEAIQESEAWLEEHI